MTYTSEVLADSPWGFWLCDELSGSTLVDSSGNGRNMGLSGSFTLGSVGPVDYAVEFSAFAGYGATSASHAPSADTQEIWVYLKSTPTTATPLGAHAVGVGDSTHDKALIVDTDGKVKFYVYDGSPRVLSAPTALSLNTWHHVVASVGAAGMKIRIDKSTVASNGGVTSSFTGVAQKFFLRQGGDAIGSVGSIQGTTPLLAWGLATYESQLSDARVDAHFDALGPGGPSGVASASGESDATAAGTRSAGGVASGSGASEATASGAAAEVGTARASGQSNATATGQRVIGTTRNRVGGRRRLASACASWLPAVDERPPHIVVGESREKAAAFTVDFVTQATGAVVPVLDESVAAIPRARHRVIIGGRDVTYFRGIVTPLPSYQLVEPLLYGPATVELSQVSPSLEELGTGALSWLAPGKTVVIQRVDDDDVVVATDWVGVVIAFDTGGPVGQALRVQCGGEAAGRAALIDKQVPLFSGLADLGRYAYGAIKDLGLILTPHLGPTTGIKLGKLGGSSHLDYITDLVARGWTRSGTQWTIAPDAPEDGGRYRMFRKDIETIDGTVYLDDQRTVGDLRRDIAEEPNRIFGTGVTPEGMRVMNGVYPGLRQGPPAPYPFNDDRTFDQGTTDLDTDTGDGVSVMINRLQVTGYLDQRDNPGGYDIDVTRAIRDLQEDAADGPTFISGDMNPETWDALFDVAITGFSLNWSHIEPMAQAPRVRRFRRSASGAVIARNPRFKPDALPVDAGIDFGSGYTVDQMHEWAKSELQTTDQKNWVGTIRFPLGAYIVGQHVLGDLTPEMLASTRALRPGMNLWAPLFDGGTLFHVAGVSVAEDGVVTAMVDTRARDAMKVWAIIARNREARKNPARLWLQEHRSSTQLHDSITDWSEIGGEVQRIPLTGGAWNVFECVAGQEGTVRSLRLALENPTEFVVAVFGMPIWASRLQRLVGDPLTKHGSKQFAEESVRDALDRRNILLYVAGSWEQPCGYYPGNKLDQRADGGDYFITGRWEDDAGFSYHTFRKPVLYVAVWPAEDTAIPAGRIMYNQLEAGV